MYRMGERIKKNRKKTGIQLSELAKIVRVSPSCLSQIENAKSFPSIVTLKKIADALNTTVGSLIGENENLSNNPLVKNNEKKFVEEISKGVKLYLLSHHDVNKQMETFFIKFNKGAFIDNLLEQHPGQTFFYLINGKIEITLKSKNFILDKGSCFYIKSDRYFSAKNIFKGISQVLWIITPPIF